MKPTTLFTAAPLLLLAALVPQGGPVQPANAQIGGLLSTIGNGITSVAGDAASVATSVATDAASVATSVATVVTSGGGGAFSSAYPSAAETQKEDCTRRQDSLEQDVLTVSPLLAFLLPYSFHFRRRRCRFQYVHVSSLPFLYYRQTPLTLPSPSTAIASGGSSIVSTIASGGSSIVSAGTSGAGSVASAGTSGAGSAASAAATSSRPNGAAGLAHGDARAWAGAAVAVMAAAAYGGAAVL